MKRARRWLLMFAALVGLMAHAGALRPVFAKGPTTTKASTTTTTAPTTTTTTAAPEETTDEIPPAENITTTKSTKTGIPQIDYVWDPNLPRELNGYNLSEYPFFDSVPTEAEIDFKCQGLHDGFYASVKHKCQLYHHCIYGIRHDFLCANFTAFDQKTFICHFASEVDCKNSAKYFHRNDALYKATTTTSTTTTTTPAPPTQPGRDRPGRPFRRPLRRRRPVDYYYDEDYDEDYYEERVNRRRKQRPRTRRPEYDEEYETQRGYDDEDRFEKRPANRERTREDPDDYAYERRPAERPRNRNRPGDSRRFNEDERFDRRKIGDRRRPQDDRKAASDERIPGDRRLSSEDRRSLTDIEPDEERRPLNGRRKNGGQRRPSLNDAPERPLRREEASKEASYDNRKEERIEPEPESAAPVVAPKAGSGSLFGRPRAPPKIAPPVPINEKKKFEYTTKKSTTAAPLNDDYEYYDDYEDLPPKKQRKDELLDRPSPRDSRPIRPPIKAPVPIKEDPKTRYETVRETDFLDDDYEERPIHNSRYKTPAERERGILKRNENSDAIDVRTRDIPATGSGGSRFDNRDSDTLASPFRERSRHSESEDVKPIPRSEEIDDSRDARPVVRVVKRPFLPSRGGSPYLPRGLQPVGAAQKSAPTESTPLDMGSTVSGVRLLEHAAPIVRGTLYDDPDDYPPPRKGPRTTQQPQIEHQRSDLEEIYNNEYDVTLNDALNPTIKPLTPNRGFPRGFSRISSPGDSYTDDSYYSSTDSRSKVVKSPITSNSRTHSSSQSRRAQQYYDDDYDY